MKFESPVETLRRNHNDLLKVCEDVLTDSDYDHDRFRETVERCQAQNPYPEGLYEKVSGTALDGLLWCRYS